MGGPYSKWVANTHGRAVATHFDRKDNNVNIPDRIDMELEAAMEQWTDQRVIETDDLYDLLALIVYGSSILVNSGFRLSGFSFRQTGDQTRLTVRVKENGTPLVAFVTGANTTSCVRRFWNLWIHDRVNWTRDRYA